MKSAKTFAFKSLAITMLLMCASRSTEQVNATNISELSAQQGIFSKLIAEQEEQHSFEKEIEDAKERKRIQLAEAEKEHDKLVEQEEKEEAEQKAKEDAARE